MDIGSVFLNVLAIIGIIIAGGFVIFFLGDLLLSILDPENSAIRKSNNKQKDVYKEPEYTPLINEFEKPQELTYDNPNKESYEQVDYAKAAEEEKMLEQSAAAPIFYSEPVKPVQESNVSDFSLNDEEKPTFSVEEVKEEVQNTSVEVKQEESTQPEDIFAQLRAEEEKFKQEKLKAAENKKNVFAEVQAKKDEEEAEEEFNFDDIFFADDDDDVEEASQEDELLFNFDEEEEKVQPEPVKEVEPEVEPEEVKDEVDEKAEEINKEFDELKKQNEELKKQLEDMLKQKEVEDAKDKAEVEKLEEEKANLEKLLEETKETKQAGPSLSVQEYKDKLAVLKDRLKYNEKELRAIKKEFIPLRKVRKTLERDKKKLRRREALVAKQKIVLYGVNNIADIDQEKAKKLEEDLDLLDGLRLSVSHCEEVINESEDRYPALETSFNILTKTIETIKSDIEETEQNIAKLENK